MGLAGDGKIYKLSSSFSQAGISANAAILDFICHSDTVYAINEPPGVLPGYMVMDTLFNSILLSHTTTYSLQQQALCEAANRNAILSSGYITSPVFVQYNHDFATLSVIKKLSDNNFQSDVALLSVTADSAYASCTSSSFGSFCSGYVRARVKIKNTGTTVIHDFKLNLFDVPSSSGCGAFIHQEKFSGLALAPNDTITVTTHTFVGKSNGPPITTTTFTQQFCFYITVPNGETDRVPQDNGQCLQRQFVVTALRELAKANVAIDLYPNPFENSLSIESDAIIKSASVTNALGMVLKAGAFNDKRVTLNNTELPAGIYFINIETEKGTVIKKVVKQ